MPVLSYMLIYLHLSLLFKVNVTLPVWFSAFSLRHSEIKTVIPLEQFYIFMTFILTELTLFNLL